jgi:hypothetical protein
MTFALERKAVFAAQANVALKKLRRGADKPSSYSQTDIRR